MVTAVNRTSSSPEQELYDRLMQEENGFQTLSEDDKNSIVQGRLQKTKESPDAKKDLLEDKLGEDMVNQYEQIKQTGSKEEMLIFKNDILKKIVDSGEIIQIFSLPQLIKQYAKLQAHTPDKRRKELESKTENTLIAELSKELDDSNNKIRVDKNLTKIVDRKESVIRYNNLVSRRRTKRWIKILNNKTPEKAVMWMLSAQTMLGGGMVDEKLHTGFLKLGEFAGIYKKPGAVNDMLNDRYINVFKPVLDKLKKGGDEELAKQLEEKLIAVKRSYAIKQIEPLLNLKNESFI